jgi:hypothetical protein
MACVMNLDLIMKEKKLTSAKSTDAASLSKAKNS